jgi:Fe-S cluster assembly protein SufD
LSSAISPTQPVPSEAEPHGLFEKLSSLDGTLLSPEERRRALERFFRLRSGREKPGHFWKVDFESIAPDADSIDLTETNITVENPNSGLLVCDLATAARMQPELFARAFGTTGVAATKFGALASAFCGLGVFIYARADYAADEPIVVRYDAPAGAAIFPWSVVLAERGARLTVVERLAGGAGAFICGAAELVTEEHADVTFASVQQIGDGARAIFTHAARPGRDAAISWALAELGGQLAAGDLTVSIDHPGSQTSITGLFFPRSTQHVDLVSTVDHRAGEATSETVIKSAATEKGQARFLGNIRIAPHAQGSDARLRDDALLLSTTAHVDSVPALEIGANDVKAYHGATVGAIDVEQVFYMETRGIERAAAERMIALGFFEPAIERFPSTNLRDEIRAALAAKLS